MKDLFKTPLKLNLQLFAEDPVDPPEAEPKDEELEEKETVPASELHRRLSVKDRKHKKELEELQTELQALKDANKTEEEKENDKQQAIVDELAQEKTKSATLELKIEALSNGVTADKLDRFIKLASTSDKEDIADKVTDTLAEFPEFSATIDTEETKPSFIRPGNPTGADVKTDVFKAAVNKFI